MRACLTRKRLTRKCLLLVCLSAGVVFSTSGWTAPPAMPDQFGAPVGLENNPNQVQLVIVVSAKRLRRIKHWERAIRDRYASLPLLRVADVPRTSPTDMETVARTLRKRLPEDVNVAIDLEGSWAADFELDTSVPNLLIFDETGNLAGHHAGMYKKGLFEAFTVDLDQVLSP